MTFLTDLADFIRDWIWMILLCLLIVAGVALLIVGEQSTYNEFMAECQQYHAKYECTAMWRQGQKNYVPIPVFLPSTH